MSRNVEQITGMMKEGYELIGVVKDFYILNTLSTVTKAKIMMLYFEG